MSRLDAASVADLLQGSPHWHYNPDRGGAISREFTFSDFAEAFAFMARVALWAEKHDHHPEWSNVYNRVRVTLTTHDMNGVSMKDIELARLMHQLAG
jgi:4a-hydroxytetrahydrobiopterin dehydratase